MIKFLQKPAFIYLVAVLALYLNFGHHLFSSLSLDKFIEDEFQSERFVFSRLIHDLDHGTADEGGFMLRHEEVDRLYRSVNRDDYADFKLALFNNTAYQRYVSHAGLQDDIVFPLWQGLEWIKGIVLEHAREGSRWHTRLQSLDYYYYILISKNLVALINALVLGLFVLWAARMASPAHGWITLGLILLLLPVLGFYGRSLWWMMWSWFAPFILKLFAYYGREESPKLWYNTLIGVIVGGLVCIKALMGYEFTSTVMVAAMIPTAFYAVYYKWGWKGWFLTSLPIGTLCLAGVMAAFAIHWHQLGQLGIDNPLDIIKSRYEMRAYGGEHMSHKGEILRSTESSVLGVVGGYLISGKELGWPQLMLICPLLYFCYLAFMRKAFALTQMSKALLVSIALAFGGALSMFIILKGHAYIHGYDVVAWSIPLNLILLFFYALWLKPLDGAGKSLLEERSSGKIDA